MKKLLVLALVVFGLAACQTEPQFDVQMGGEQEVMLTVSLPETTRANSADGFDINHLGDYSLRYILEVYRVNDDETVLYDTCQRFVETSDDTSMVFPVRLAPGYDYRIVAWTDIVEKSAADPKADRCYKTTAGLDAVEIIDGMWKPMDETRDAYTAVKVVDDFNSSSNLDMILTRPFAKLRVVATDIDDIRKVGLEPKTAIVEYNQVPRQYNAVADIENKGIAKEESEEEKEHEFSYPATPVYDDATGEYTLFADYIFVPTDGTAQFSLNVYADADQLMLIKNNNFNTEIFVERNKLTTIKGDVLTIGGDVKVEVENDLGIKEEISYVDTIESLQDKINNAPDGTSTKIVLGGDVAIEPTTRAESQYGLVIPAGTKVVLDLNGHTIGQSKAQSGKYAMIENNGTLTICNSANTNGVISYGDTATLTAAVGYASNTIQNNGTLTINEGVTLLNTSGTDVATYGYPHVIDTNGKLTINGGVLTNEANYSTMRIWTSNTDSEKCVVTINGGTFNGCIDFQSHNNNYATMPHYGTLTVTGGTFNPDTYTKTAIRVLRFGVNSDDMHATIRGGHFSGKIAVRNYSSSNETPKIFDIYGGTFNTAAKEGTDVNLLANGYAFVEGENGVWTVENVGHYTDAEGNYYITNANGLKWFADKINSFELINANVALVEDIDLSGIEWTPIGMSTNLSNNETFRGTFDGRNHTISGLTVNQPEVAGLFGYVYAATIKNVNIVGANINSNHYAGGIVAWVLNNRGNIQVPFVMENCHVKNSTITSAAIEINGAWDNGDKAGGLVGYACFGDANYAANAGAKISGCSVENTTIKAYRDFAGLVGYASYVVLENCTTNNITLEQDLTHDYKTTTPTTFGLIIGRNDGGNTVDGASVINTAEQLAEAIEAGKNVILGADVVTVTKPLTVGKDKNVTLDLNGHNITSNIAGKPSGFELFYVSGKLNIVGKGNISLTSEDFEWNTSYRYTAINIRETGVVTLGKDVSVICEASKNGSYGMSYAVDIYTTGTLNINGASLHSNYIAVRCFFGNSVVNVNSGSKITSSKNNYGIWLQSSPNAVVTIADDVKYTLENNIYYFN